MSCFLMLPPTLPLETDSTHRREQRQAIERDVCRVLVVQDTRYKDIPITCPIGLGLIEDPVSVADSLGTTFERSNIERFLAECERQGKAPFNPSAGGQLPLASTTLTANMTVRQIINGFLKTVGEELVCVACVRELPCVREC